jgi:hypothetical protein
MQNENVSGFQKKKELHEKYRHWEIMLLTTIGLFLALPASCNLIQRIVDNLTSFDVIQHNTSLIIKLSTDICLGIFYFFGLIALVFFGFSAYTALRSIDTLGPTFKVASEWVVNKSPGFLEKTLMWLCQQTNSTFLLKCLDLLKRSNSHQTSEFQIPDH